MRGQRNEVMKHLLEKGELTSMEAFDLYGCTRLAALVHDFRSMGYEIVTVYEESKNRYGETCRYARYVIAPRHRVEYKNAKASKKI